MTDLFDYPAHPGAKQRGATSEEAARIIGTKFRPSHEKILEAFTKHGPMTPDELAEKTGRSVFYTRPRCSELRLMGLLHPTGEVRHNESGLKAQVLVP